MSSLKTAFEAARDLEGPLNARLEMYLAAVRQHFSAYGDAFDELVARLRSVGAGDAAPAVGEPLPPFLLPDQDGRLVHSSDLIAAGPVAVVFLRGHWCSFCRLTARALAEAETRAAAFGGRIVAITPEHQAVGRLQRADAGAGYSVLSDIDHGYALSLNLAIWIGEEMRRVFETIEIRLPDYQRSQAWLLPIPATFVVGRQGLITARFVDPDYTRRMDIDDLLAALAEAR